MLIKLTEENEAWGVNGTERGCALLVVDVEELILLSDSGVLGNIEEDLSVLSADSLTEVGNGELRLIDLLLELSAVNFVGGRANLLEDPVDNFVFSATTRVFNLLSFPI